MKVTEAGLRIRPWGLKTARDDLIHAQEDLVFMIRRAAYVDEIRHEGLRVRRIGWATLLAGLAMLLWAATRGPGVHSTTAHWGECAIALAWALFIYVMVRRTRYVRAHPFDPNR